MGVEGAVAEGHLGHHQVHPHGVGDGRVLPAVLGPDARGPRSIHSSLRNGYGIAWLLVSAGRSAAVHPPRSRPSGTLAAPAGSMPCRDRSRDGRRRAVLGHRRPRGRPGAPRLHRAPRSRCGGWPSSWPTPGSPSSCRCCPATAPRSRTWSPPRWADWSAAAEEAYARPGRPLRRGWRWSGCRWAAPSPAGWPSATPRSAASSWSNPLVEPPGRRASATPSRSCSTRATEIAPGIGSDIARPGVVELSYDGTPAAPPCSPSSRGPRRWPRPGRRSAARCSCFSSRQDHVVPPDQRRPGRGLGRRTGASGCGSSAASTWPRSTTTATRSRRAPSPSSPP